jgi:molecular chaperone IbpA
MTNAKLAVADLHKFMLGFDRMFNDTSVFAPTLDGGYPRFNILRVGEQGFRVELAVPGWNKDDLEISLHKGLLTVSGTVKQVESSNEAYVYKGLSGKCFSRTFGVSEHVKLDRAYMERGLLCIDLHEEIPNELQPIKVTIS